MKYNLSYYKEELGCVVRISSGCLIPLFQPQGRIQKVETRVGYIKPIVEHCIHTETSQIGQGTNGSTSHRWYLGHQEIDKLRKRLFNIEKKSIKK